MFYKFAVSNKIVILYIYKYFKYNFLLSLKEHSLIHNLKHIL